MSVHSSDRILSFTCDDSAESQKAEKLLKESGLEYQRSVGHSDKIGEPVMITTLSRAPWRGYREIEVGIKMLLLKSTLN